MDDYIFLSLNSVIDGITDNILIIILLAMVVVMAMLLVNVRMREAAQREAANAKKKLEENYIELEEAYKKVKTTQEELAQKYEELKRSEERNKKLAYVDCLTDLPNRISFTEQLEERIEQMDKDEHIAIMYIDLDNFKNINDVLGHSYGDELLIDVTDRVKQVLDEHDYFARFGGDEFIILSGHVESTELYEEKIRKIQKVFTYPFVLSMREFFVTTSIGVAFAPNDGKTPQILIKNVDAAMYSAKAQGKNTYCYYNETINESLLTKIELQSELRNALNNNEFAVFYQAQIDLKKDKIVGFEALVRWLHPEKGIVGPGGFVQVAEETGLIVPIGRFVLFEACRQLKRWEDMGFDDISIAVNLSARQFKDADIIAMVYEVIEETQIDPGKLDLEITESIAIENIEYTIEIIQKLKEIGVKFSLDDFGTGYSSMNYLKHLPVNNLKIDKSFLDRVIDNTSDQQIVSTIITLAQTLDLVVIAEGVEISEQAVFLKQVNCNQAQGYLYSKPIPEVEAGNLLKHFKNKKINVTEEHTDSE